MPCSWSSFVVVAIMPLALKALSYVLDQELLASKRASGGGARERGSKGVSDSASKQAGRRAAKQPPFLLLLLLQLSVKNDWQQE